MINDTRPVVSYARISRRKGGDGKGATLGIARQHRENRAYIGIVFPGAEIIELDDNMSAWDENKKRDGWEEMLGRIAAGEFRAVVAWHADRFTRQPLQLEYLWKACRSSGTELHTFNGGHHAKATMLRIEGALAADESDQKSARITLKVAELANNGTPSGGKRRFGYEAHGMAVRESEAVIIRDIAARIIRGESLSSIAKRLNDEGIPTALGVRWSGSNIGKMMRRPHLAGLRVYRGEIIGQASWDRIIEPGTREELLAVLDAADRPQFPNTATRVHLLSGLAVCGSCGRNIRAMIETRNRKGRTTRQENYRCPDSHCSRPLRDIDAYVTGAIVARLSRLDASGLWADDEPAREAAALRAAIEAIDSNIGRLAQLVATLELAPEAYAAATKPMTTERTRLAARRAELIANTARPKAALDGMTGELAQAAWDSAELGQRREIINALCRIEIHKAPSRGAKFDGAQTVSIIWRDPAAA